MSTALLTCKICSKKPSFSDVSHLLTHVGSKGHLSQLHKLQVKSHQEIAEALQLVDYNQWYQEHGLAQLLSERLQQKEKKQAAKQGVKKENVVKIEDDSAEAQPVRQKARSRGRAKVKRDDDEVNEPARSAYAPVNTDYPLTPLRESCSLPYTAASIYSSPDNLDPALGASPVKSNTNAKLKGKIWPGMALFDAASPEEARRRNQKKDASVVKKMERLSRLVEPSEITYSAEWSPRKNRHIDDLDDASSLIEGESPPMIKPKPKAKRKVLGAVSGNVGRPSKRKSRPAPSPKRPRRQAKAVRPSSVPSLPPLNQAGGSHASAYSTQPQNSHATYVDASLLESRFDVFEDSPAAPTKAAGCTARQMSLSRSYHQPVPRLSFQTASWLQPQKQTHNPLFLDSHFNGYKADSALESLQHLDNVKAEQIQPDHGHLNPLAWLSPSNNQGQLQFPESSFSPFSGYVAAMGLPDPFGTTRNPLANAFAHFSGNTNSTIRGSIR